MNQSAATNSYCENCAYYHELINGQGRCHRFPPSYIASSSDINIHHWQLPMVHNSSWCGEHKRLVPEVPVLNKNI